MSKPRHHESIHLAEWLLVVIALAGVVFTGYYIYHSQQQTNQTYSSAAKVAASTPAKAAPANTFAACEKAAGSITQQSYPETCITKGGTSFTQPITTTATMKAPADSATPAASSCATQAGATVTVTLDQGIPSPRCVSVTATQTLNLVNPGTTSTTATLGDLAVTIPAGQSAMINEAFGDYLATGVHIIHTPVYGGSSGPEIWLK